MTTVRTVAGGVVTLATLAFFLGTSQFCPHLPVERDRRDRSE